MIGYDTVFVFIGSLVLLAIGFWAGLNYGMRMKSNGYE